MNNINVVLLSDSELYDIIVDVVGDETSLEFCTLSSYYLDDNTLDASMELHGTHAEDINPLIDEVEERAAEYREQQREQNQAQEGSS